MRRSDRRPPAGSVITASLSESQTSSPPRRIGSRLPPRRAAASEGRPAPPSASCRRILLGDARDPFRGRVPEHDPAVAIDGDDPVGDVGEDRLAALLLVADALVEVGVDAGGGGVRSERVQAPRPPPRATRAAAVSRRRGCRAPPPRARASARRDSRRSRRRASRRPRPPRVAADVGDRARRARLDEVADEPRGRARASRARRPHPGRRPPARRPRLPPARGPRPRRRRGSSTHAARLVEHVVGIELPARLATGPGESLREVTGRRRSLGSSLRSSAPRAAAATWAASSSWSSPKSARPRRRRARARPPGRPAAGAGQPGASRGAPRPPPPRARCRSARRRGADGTRAFPPRGTSERGRGLPRWAASPRRARRSRPAQARRRRPEHCGRAAAERLGGRLGDGVERLLLGERLAQHGGDPVEAALDPRLPDALLVGLRVSERDRGEAGEGLDQPQVRLLEAPGVARADAEHAADLAEGEDRRLHHLGEDGVGACRRRLLGLRELAPQHRLAVAIASPTVPTTESCARSRSRAGPARHGRRARSPRQGVQQSAASALTSARSSSASRSITASKRRSLVSARRP